MKIGILTFHWAANYGAILQAFALQTYLKKNGHEVYIINYRPRPFKKTLLSCLISRQLWSFLSKLKRSIYEKKPLLTIFELLFVGLLKEYIKERKLEKFRKTYLNETLLYCSLNELKINSPKFDVYVCGSDQIWNPSFTTRGEGKPTSSYFLDFGGENVKRIAYSVSFGCENYPEAALSIAQKYIHNFNAISVRENSAIAIVKRIGFMNPIKLPDPTLLLFPDDYCFLNTHQVLAEKKAFVYILREEYKEAKDIVSYLKRSYKIDSTNKLFNSNSVEEWVSGIKNASIVLTNSFHGMVFSLIFHVPFIIVQAKGYAAGMNDRFITLLSYLNLEHRIMNAYDSDKLDRFVNEQINWQMVDNQLSELRGESDKFFNQKLN